MKTHPPLLLASKSPRRRSLFASLGYTFDVASNDVDETFPDTLSAEEAIRFVVEKKAMAFKKEAQTHIVIVADTMVSLDGVILGKPSDPHEATAMLQQLSGNCHQVLTSVTLLHKDDKESFIDTTQVHFRILSPVEISRYIASGLPFDKAGGYGIQDWIGLIGITHIHGSYTNVVGLPTEKVYSKLTNFMARC